MACLCFGFYKGRSILSHNFQIKYVYERFKKDIKKELHERDLQKLFVKETFTKDVYTRYVTLYTRV